MKSIAWTLVLAPLLVSSAAHGDDAETKARAYFKNGTVAFDAGHYDEAQAEFAAGYDLSHKAGFLWNMAECARLLGNLPRALDLYTQYVASAPPSAPQRATAELRIRELTPTVSAAASARAADLPSVPAAATTSVPAATPRPVDSPSGRPSATVSPTSPVPSNATAAAMQPRSLETATGSNPRILLGLTAAGFGIAGLAVGSVIGVLAKRTYDNALSHCPAGLSACDAQGVDGVKNAHVQATESTVAFVAGGVLVATGAVLYLTAPRAGHVTVRPSLGTATAGLTIAGGW
jgi:hypothetical protein